MTRAGLATPECREPFTGRRKASLFSSAVERRFHTAEVRGAAPRAGTVAVAQWQSSGL